MEKLLKTERLLHCDWYINKKMQTTTSLAEFYYDSPTKQNPARMSGKVLWSVCLAHRMFEPTYLGK